MLVFKKNEAQITLYPLFNFTTWDRAAIESPEQKRVCLFSR